MDPLPTAACTAQSCTETECCDALTCAFDAALCGTGLEEANTAQASVECVASPCAKATCCKQRTDIKCSNQQADNAAFCGAGKKFDPAKLTAEAASCPLVPCTDADCCVDSPNASTKSGNVSRVVYFLDSVRRPGTARAEGPHEGA